MKIHCTVRFEGEIAVQLLEVMQTSFSGGEEAIDFQNFDLNEEWVRSVISTDGIAVI